MDVWRLRPDAQQLGKVWPPSQPAENFKPAPPHPPTHQPTTPACVGEMTAETTSASDREDSKDRHTRPLSPPGIHKRTIAQVRRGGGEKKTRVGCSFLDFSLAILPQDRRFAALPKRHKLCKLQKNCKKKKNNNNNNKNRAKNAQKKRAPGGKKRAIQLVQLALSLHIAAGECALKITWLLKWKKKRNPFAGEEFALKADTSFSSM